MARSCPELAQRGRGRAALDPQGRHGPKDQAPRVALSGARAAATPLRWRGAACGFVLPVLTGPAETHALERWTCEQPDEGTDGEDEDD